VLLCSRTYSPAAVAVARERYDLPDADPGPERYIFRYPADGENSAGRNFGGTVEEFDAVADVLDRWWRKMKEHRKQ